MTTDFFSGISAIEYEGPDSDNPLAFRYYDPGHEVLGKSMRDHLRFSVCFWHSFCWPGADMFGDGVFARPWFEGDDPKALAEHKTAVAFEFFEKIRAPYFCFHDRDLAPEGATLAESNGNLDHMVVLLQELLEHSEAKLLWGTANLFSNPRYAAGAATNPDPEIFAYAAAQVKHVLEATHQLGGANYVLWGGREGYDTLLNTDTKREVEQLGRFMTIVAEHKHKIGFKGTLLLEPKPHEPTKHQYDFDAASCHAFLQKFDLVDEFKLNIEVNHATLAGHTFEHELAYAAANGILGSVDINRGDTLLGWDTDQFPNNPEEVTLAMLVVLSAGGLGNGGFNFDAKLRRQSIDPIDLFHAHIGGIDMLARGLRNAASLIEDGTLHDFIAERYASWNTDDGKTIANASMAELSSLVLDSNMHPHPKSGRQEMLENLINRHI